MLETSYNDITNISPPPTANAVGGGIVKIYYFEQSAGNQRIYNKYILVGSSETTRNLLNKFIMKRYSPLNNSLKRFYYTDN